YFTVCAFGTLCVDLPLQIVEVPPLFPVLFLFSGVTPWMLILFRDNQSPMQSGRHTQNLVLLYDGSQAYTTSWSYLLPSLFVIDAQPELIDHIRNIRQSHPHNHPE